MNANAATATKALQIIKTSRTLVPGQFSAESLHSHINSQNQL